MNEYRIQRLKEELTYAQQRNKRQKQQLANYKKVHEKDLKEIERLNDELKSDENYYVRNLKEYVRDLKETVMIQDKEVEKLNNVINKLEIILQQDLECEKDVYWTNITKEDYIQFMLKKIQELKGEDK